MSAAGQGVVVTGMGATTPLGGDVSTTWDGLLAGASGTRPLSEEYARFELPVDFASQLAVEPDGAIWVLEDGASGRLVRLDPV